MQILTNETYPVVTERNKRIHVPTAVGQVAIYRGEAVEVKPAPRGSREWLEEMKARSAAVTAPDAHDTPAPFFATPVWSVIVGESRTVYVEKRLGSESTQYEKPPADAPNAIVEQYRELKSIDPAANALELDAARRKQQDYENSVQLAKRW